MISWNHGFLPFVAFLKIMKVWLEREWERISEVNSL